MKSYEKNISKNCKRNAKSFWKYVNSKLKRSTGICNLIKSDGTLTTSDKDKAQVLNEFFSSVFTSENIKNVPILKPHNNNTFIPEILLTSTAVKNKLNNLKVDKATGPDKIPPFLLKSLSEELSHPISMIFNKSLSEGYVPSQWKEAEVTAIHKKGDKNKPNNYRPVSLSCILCKILESFISENIQNYMEQYHLFNDAQHGFRRQRSCVTQLLDVMNTLTNLIDNNYNVDILYLDFSKAFDTVPHKRLLYKLNSYGIEGNLLKWIESFLTNRKQRVKVNGEYSDYAPVTSGIPQGSILGPLLFIIFINDLPEGVSNFCKIFADDTKLFGTTDNHLSIQNDLNLLMKWSEDWQLKFNVDKCNVLHIGKNNPKNDYFMNPEKTKKTY